MQLWEKATYVFPVEFSALAFQGRGRRSGEVQGGLGAAGWHGVRRREGGGGGRSVSRTRTPSLRAMSCQSMCGLPLAPRMGWMIWCAFCVCPRAARRWGATFCRPLQLLSPWPRIWGTRVRARRLRAGGGGSRRRPPQRLALPLTARSCAGSGEVPCPRRALLPEAALPLARRRARALGLARRRARALGGALHS